jgi:hypothetical protein
MQQQQQQGQRLEEAKAETVADLPAVPSPVKCSSSSTTTETKADHQ